jgi:hypothetical protein
VDEDRFFGIFVGAGHALPYNVFLKKFNPFRVVNDRECVFCMEV